MQQISLVWILQKVLQILHGLLNTILYFGKRGRENQREMKPGALIAQNAIVFRDMYLQFSNYLRAALQFACLELVGCDWWTNLALGIHESLRGFQLLWVKGLKS